MHSETTLSVVIPTLNEARNIEHVLGLLPDTVDEVILVDGGSTDATVAIARRARPGIRVLGQTRPGKGSALATGILAATGDEIVTIDADGSMDPREIERFVAPLRAGAQYVRGSRFSRGGGSADITAVRFIGNKVLNSLANLLFGTGHSDLCYGFNAMTREAAGALRLPDPADGTRLRHWGDGFEIETLMHVRAVKAGLRVVEVPSFEASRRFGESNLSAVRDGLRCLRTLLFERFVSASVDSVVDAERRARPKVTAELVGEGE
ncbi:glycosyltransferase involved in cell wall biosynthesis [Microbacterium sp. SLBN-154]|uniref:glycosyltransferase family 2 protein n=1 Tax=Microbacterium sp. SLBN-154 TaxID=2768458 RepID=UPI001169F45E|nr:glycosyltransferase family 2 protein [Microbacterium sp. SLBN-154]TQK18711.1 glycosyltransferase involved in cell wall biosynthesis [Microbacterium sp. SLBN-154]